MSKKITNKPTSRLRQTKLSINLISPKNDNTQQKKSQSPKSPGFVNDDILADSPNSYTDSFCSSTFSPLYGEESDVSPSTFTGHSKTEIGESDCVIRAPLNKNKKSNSKKIVPGYGLISEIIKVQGLLEEYHHALTVIEFEKADKQQEINKLDKLLKGKGETEERYKYEIWSLNSHKQELLQKINDLSDELSKSNTEKARLMQAEIVLSQELEQLKMSMHSQEKEQLNARNLYEKEIMQQKKLVHDLTVEKDTFLKELEELKESEPTENLIHQQPIEINQTIEKQSLEIESLKLSLEKTNGVIRELEQEIGKERLFHAENSEKLTEAKNTIENLNNQISKLKSEEPLQPKLDLSENTNTKLDSNQEELNISLKGASLEKTNQQLPKKTNNCSQEIKSAGNAGGIESVTLSTVHLLPIYHQHNPIASCVSEEGVDGTIIIHEKQKIEPKYYGSLIKEPESYIYSTKLDRVMSESKFDSSKTEKDSFSPIKLNFTENFSVDTELLNEDEINEDKGGESSVKAMTQAMNGDWMWKYTGKSAEVKKLENKHRRFFWIHPYTLTLYWSTKEPGSNNSQCNTKSVLIESFKVLNNPTEKNQPPCIYIQAPSRAVQIQCLDFDTHYAWVKTLHYLLADNVAVQNLVPTKMLPENGKVILDRKKFSNLRRSSQFFKNMKQDNMESNRSPSLRYRSTDSGSYIEKRSIAHSSLQARGSLSSIKAPMLVSLSTNEGFQK